MRLKGSVMNAPLKMKQYNAVNAHQYRYLIHKEGIPYQCFRCDSMVVAEERGLVCPKCGEVTTTFPYVTKMFDKIPS